MADAEGFDAFAAAMSTRLSRAFVAAYGPERGADALGEAMAYAWERRAEVMSMENPAGFLYRVGQSRSRPRRRLERFRLPTPESIGLPDVEPGLVLALERLSERQRTCVALVHGFGWSQREVADLLGLSASSVQNHVERGLDRLRASLGVVDRA